MVRPLGGGLGLQLSNDHANPTAASERLPSPGLEGDISSVSSDHHALPRPTKRARHVEPYTTAGQFALAPATQQTTVVTTTTTTVNLAPFVLPPPTSLADKDPRQYPLAGISTPHHMKDLKMIIGGTMTTFREAEETGQFLQNYDDMQRLIKRKGGNLRHQESSQFAASNTGSNGTSNPRRRRTTGSAFVPPSLVEAANLVDVQRRNAAKSPLLASSQGHSPSQSQRQHTLQPSALSKDGISPITPGVEVNSAFDSDSSHRGAGDFATQPQRGARQSPPRSLGLARSAYHTNEQTAGRETSDLIATAPVAGSLAAATPPIMDSDVEADAPRSLRHPSSMLPPLGIGAHQDASLPSPSLSPVTAAANLAQRQLLGTRLPDNDDVSEMSGLDTVLPRRKRKTPPLFEARQALDSQGAIHSADDELPSRANQPRTLLDIPDMISMFDALPSEMQSYVMYQLLRRSSKKTLRTIADVVNPALKCDPFDMLPTELSLKITKMLDGQSMGRAAQVSKRWRHLINSDETAWRDLLDREGYMLPDGEVERAIKEGWAWQFPGHDDHERDLSTREGFRGLQRRTQGSSVQTQTTITSDDESMPTSRGTRKRKGPSLTSASKRQKHGSVAPHEGEITWMRELQKGQGPIAYASAAAKAVPDPKIGLPSLKSLHLFKSIYQRHRMVREAWMDEDSQPHHLAFRAHHRHVVTCLLFDSDRIITGSDDTSINVFDTKTGVLRRRLTGHEGGVWALACDGDTLVSGSTDRSVRVWDIKSGRCMQTFQGHTSTVRCLVILRPVNTGEDDAGNPIMCPEEPIIITGSRDSTLRVWKLPKPTDPAMHQASPPESDADNQYALRTLSGHHNSVRAIAAYGDTLVSGSYDCTVRVWHVSTGEMVHRLHGHTQKVYSVVLDYERGRCISGSMDNMVKVWSLDTGLCLFNLEGHTSLVGLLELSHERLVSAAADSTLRIWDPENGACRNTLSAHTGAITCFQHDGQKVISGSDRTLKMWNIETGECTRDLLTDLSGVWQVRFDDRRCVAAVQRNNLTYIEVLDFGASRDGVSLEDRGRRIVVDEGGDEIDDEELLLAEEAEDHPGAVMVD